MAQYVKMENWPRRKTFNFFKSFELPFFEICLDVDITPLRRLVKQEELKMTIALLYVSLRAANETQEFRYRLRGDEVLIHDCIHAGSTVLNDDGETFGFWYPDYDTHFRTFAQQASESLVRFRSSGDNLNPRDEQDNVIHYSMVPWFRFNTVTHARRLNPNDSVPKFVFGKFEEEHGKTVIPFSVSAHHALVDGLHVGRLVDRLNRLIADCETIWHQ